MYKSLLTSEAWLVRHLFKYLCALKILKTLESSEQITFSCTQTASVIEPNGFAITFTRFFLDKLQNSNPLIETVISRSGCGYNKVCAKCFDGKVIKI